MQCCDLLSIRIFDILKTAKPDFELIKAGCDLLSIRIFDILKTAKSLKIYNSAKL